MNKNKVLQNIVLDENNNPMLYRGRNGKYCEIIPNKIMLIHDKPGDSQPYTLFLWDTQFNLQSGKFLTNVEVLEAKKRLGSPDKYIIQEETHSIQ